MTSHTLATLEANAEREAVPQAPLPLDTATQKSRAEVSTSLTSIGELRKLARHSSHYLVSLVVSLAVGFISFPIFTRVFSVADYGLIDFASKILLLGTAASKMGLQNAALRFYDHKEFQSRQDERQRYYATMFFGTLLSAGVVTLLFAGGIRFAPAKLIDTPLATILLIGSSLILLRSMESVLLAFLRIEERTKTYAIVTVAMRAGTVAAVCLMMSVIGRSARTYFLGAIAVELVAVLVMSFMLAGRRLLNLSQFNLNFFRVTLVFGLPLIINEIAFIVLDAGDRVLVRHYLGAVALGHYSVAYGLSHYVNELLIMPLNLAMVPIYMRLWTSQGKESTTRFLTVSLDLFLLAATGLFAVTLVASRDALVLLASAKYQSAAYLIPILVAGFLIYTTQVFLSAGLMIHKKTKTMAALMIWSAAVNLILNWFLLPRLGLVAAALATVLSFALCVFLLWRATAPLLPLKIDLVAVLKYLAAATIACAGTYWLDSGIPFLNALIKAVAAVTLYGLMLYLLDARVRRQAANSVRWLRGRLNHPVPAEVSIAGD